MKKHFIYGSENDQLENILKRAMENLPRDPIVNQMLIPLLTFCSWQIFNNVTGRFMTCSKLGFLI